MLENVANKAKISQNSPPKLTELLHFQSITSLKMQMNFIP